jgi:hypothetical protein
MKKLRLCTIQVVVLQLKANRGCTSRLTPYRYVSWIATESSSIILNALQTFLLIKQSDIAGSCDARIIKIEPEAKYLQSIIASDDNNVCTETNETTGV